VKPRRLYVLLAVMGGLLGLRLWSLAASNDAPVEVAAAVVRPAASAPAASPAVDERRPDDLSAGTRDIDPEEPRNAFAVRQPPQPPAPPPPPPPSPQQVKLAAAKPFIGPPAPVPRPPAPPPPPPPPPPFQVIGSWRDDAGVSLFVAGPRGVQQARVGDVIADYRFAKVSPSQVLLKHLPSNRDVPLPVPAGAGTSLLTSP